MIINKVNGCKYIGQTTQGMNKRWKQHIDEAKRMSSKPLHCAMRKHGNHNFIIKEICECHIDELNDKERYYIKEYNTFESSQGYNATSGGEGGLLSQEIKDKISKTMSNVERTEEWTDNISSTLKGKLDKNEKWGFHLSENRGNGKHMATKIMGVNIETGEEVVWDSISEAAIELTGDRKKSSNIIQAAKHGWKAYGYLWKKMEASKHSMPVYGVHKQTWIRTPTYKSIKEAARQFGSNNDGDIRNSIKHPRRRSWKGYYWFKA